MPAGSSNSIHPKAQAHIAQMACLSNLAYQPISLAVDPNSNYSVYSYVLHPRQRGFYENRPRCSFHEKLRVSMEMRTENSRVSLGLHHELQADCLTSQLPGYLAPRLDVSFPDRSPEKHPERIMKLTGGLKKTAPIHIACATPRLILPQYKMIPNSIHSSEVELSIVASLSH